MEASTRKENPNSFLPPSCTSPAAPRAVAAPPEAAAMGMPWGTPWGRLASSGAAGEKAGARRSRSPGSCGFGAELASVLGQGGGTRSRRGCACASVRLLGTGGGWLRGRRAAGRVSFCVQGSPSQRTSIFLLCNTHRGSVTRCSRRQLVLPVLQQAPGDVLRQAAAMGGTGSSGAAFQGNERLGSRDKNQSGPTPRTRLVRDLSTKEAPEQQGVLVVGPRGGTAWLRTLPRFLGGKLLV